MACSQTINGLVRDCASSMGGIVEVLLANYDEVKTVTVDEGRITAIEMYDGGLFKPYHFRRNTSSMTSTYNIDPANGVNYVSTELVMLFSRMDATKRLEMTALALNELVALVKDANGKWWYLGYDEPLAASAGDGQTGTARSDGNRYSITLQDNSTELPLEVDSDIIAGLMTDTTAA